MGQIRMALWHCCDCCKLLHRLSMDGTQVPSPAGRSGLTNPFLGTCQTRLTLFKKSRISVLEVLSPSFALLFLCESLLQSWTSLLCFGCNMHPTAGCHVSVRFFEAMTPATGEIPKRVVTMLPAEGPELPATTAAEARSKHGRRVHGNIPCANGKEDLWVAGQKRWNQIKEGWWKREREMRNNTFWLQNNMFWLSFGYGIICWPR